MTIPLSAQSPLLSRTTSVVSGAATICDCAPAVKSSGPRPRFRFTAINRASISAGSIFISPNLFLLKDFGLRRWQGQRSRRHIGASSSARRTSIARGCPSCSGVTTGTYAATICVIICYMDCRLTGIGDAATWRAAASSAISALANPPAPPLPP